MCCTVLHYSIYYLDICAVQHCTILYITWIYAPLLPPLRLFLYGFSFRLALRCLASPPIAQGKAKYCGTFVLKTELSKVVSYSTQYYNSTQYFPTLLSTALQYTALHYNILHCTTIYCTVLQYIALYQNILHYTTIYCTVLPYTALH